MTYVMLPHVKRRWTCSTFVRHSQSFLGTTRGRPPSSTGLSPVLSPLSLSVLYFDEKQDLKAYDDIQLGGTGQSQVSMQRKVIGHDPEPSTDPAVSTGVTPGIAPTRR